MLPKFMITLLWMTLHSCIVLPLNSPITTYKMYGDSLVTFGRFTYGIENLSIMQFGEAMPLTIGQFTSIAHDVTIFLGGNHKMDCISTFPFGHFNTEYFGGLDTIGHLSQSRGRVTIGNDVWIGYGATIMSGVTIGDGAVIGTRSVVAKNVEPYSIVVGNPARHTRFRFDENVRHLLLKLRWWDLEIEQIQEIVSQLCSCPDTDMLNMLIQKYRN